MYTTIRSCNLIHAIIEQVDDWLSDISLPSIKRLVNNYNLAFNLCNMKPHEKLFLSRHIAMGRDGVEKVLEYLADYLPATFNHPAKSIDDSDMLSFLRGALQVYLEFWNATNPVQEYVPDFTKASSCLLDECANIIGETVSLLKHI